MLANFFAPLFCMVASKDIISLRALDSISLLRYVVTTQIQFDFRFSSTARYCLAAKFYFSYCFSVRIFFQ